MPRRSDELPQPHFLIHGKFANERFWGIYCFGQRHLVVKVKIFERKIKYFNKMKNI